MTWSGTRNKSLHRLHSCSSIVRSEYGVRSLGPNVIWQTKFCQRLKLCQTELDDTSNCVQYNPSSEVNNSAATRDNHHILWTLNAPLFSTLTQMYPVNTNSFYKNAMNYFRQRLTLQYRFTYTLLPFAAAVVWFCSYHYKILYHFRAAKVLAFLCPLIHTYIHTQATHTWIKGHFLSYIYYIYTIYIKLEPG